MIRTTIGEFLDGRVDPSVLRDCRVFVVRHGETTMYVGHGENVVERLQDHLTLKPLWGGDTLARLVLANEPASRDWQVEMFTLSDCDEVVQAEMARYPAWYEAPWALDIASKVMIRALRPCVNAVHNPDPSPLPADCQWPSNEVSDSEDAWRRKAAAKLRIAPETWGR